MGNSCQCPTPPGGQVNCGADQLAICRVKDGQVQSECVDQPKYLATLRPDERDTVRGNWALRIITGAYRQEDQELSDEDRRVLLSGKYRSDDGRENVTFTLPWGTENENAPTRNVLSRS